MVSFIKAVRSEQASFLDHHPNANHLLNVIARRARRTKCELNQLEIGEAFVSFRSVGMSEQQYRTAKKQLQKWALVEFKKGRKVTDKGTVALLLNSSIYDINADDANGKVTEEQRKSNGKLTTNKECKNLKNEITKDFCQQVANEYNGILSELGSIKIVSEKRTAWIRASIKQMSKTDNDFSKIETWIKYFEYVSNIDFLMGRKTDFTASFDFLVNKNNLLKVVEGNYDN